MLMTENLVSLSPDSLIKTPKRDVITGTVKLNAPSRDVWKIVGNFAGFATFITPLVWTEMTGTGLRSIRKKFFNDGNVVMEQLNSHDDEKMYMTWSLLYTSFNIGNLWASMRVQPITSSSCQVVWDIIGEPWEGGDDAHPAFDKFIKGFLSMAMSNLEAIFNQN
jgi:Polyketide cyclase / dehydrase and lipid transport